MATASSQSLPNAVVVLMYNADPATLASLGRIDYRYIQYLITLLSLTPYQFHPSRTRIWAQITQYIDLPVHIK
jgi:hypothetical protein